MKGDPRRREKNHKSSRSDLNRTLELANIPEDPWWERGRAAVRRTRTPDTASVWLTTQLLEHMFNAPLPPLYSCSWVSKRRCTVRKEVGHAIT